MPTSTSDGGSKVYVDSGPKAALWIVLIIVGTITFPGAGLALSLAAVLTTYKKSPVWLRILVVALAGMMLAFQISSLFVGGTEFHQGEPTVVSAPVNSAKS